MPPSYRERLRVEGTALAASGAIGSLLLLVMTAESRNGPASSLIQLFVVVLLLAWLGPRSVHRAIAEAQQAFSSDLGSGQPTPLWQLPLIVIGLSVVAGEVAGWDAGFRVTAGCVLVGLAQSLLLARIVAVNERASQRRYLRVEGSRILRGTKLAYTLRR